jgi:hypothetical protein
MLFHVTAKHSVNDCVTYNTEVRAALQEFLPTVPGRCEELGVKLHFALNGAPDHVFYLLLEADDYSAVCSLLCSIPMKQEFDIKPVRQLQVEHNPSFE